MAMARAIATRMCCRRQSVGRCRGDQVVGQHPWRRFGGRVAGGLLGHARTFAARDRGRVGAVEEEENRLKVAKVRADTRR